MDSLAKLVKAVLCVLAVLAIVGLFLPDRARLERSTFVEAGPGQVFDRVNKFQGILQWCPWLRGSRSVRHVLEGAGAGVGTTLVWSSDDPDIGSGSLTIIASAPYHLVLARVDLGTRGQSEFDVEIDPAPGGALVTFGLEKEFGFMLHQRYLGLLLEEMEGPGFESALLRLKTLIESAEP
jgi:hypothetical protein